MKPAIRFLCIVVMVSSAGLVSAKTIDLRNQTDAAGEHDVSFCARPSPETVIVGSVTTTLPGHAFVSFSHRPPNGQRSFQAIGHTIAAGTSTAAAAWSYFGTPVDGLIAEERYTDRMQRCLTVKLNKSEFDELRRQAFASLQEELGVGLSSGMPIIQSYRLGAADCVSFMMGIAVFIEENHPGRLRIPDDDNLLERAPLAFVGRFIQEN